MTSNNKIITIKELAEYLQIAEKTAYRLVLDKTIPAFKVGGSWRISQKEIENWVEQESRKTTKL